MAREFDGVEALEACKVQNAEFVKRFFSKIGDDLQDAPEFDFVADDAVVDCVYIVGKLDVMGRPWAVPFDEFQSFCFDQRGVHVSPNT